MNDIAPGVAAPGDLLDGRALERLYAYPDTTARAWTRANMVATLDGAAAGNDGRTASINTPADLVVYTLLRDLADVVLVGAGTARTEGYRRTEPRSPVFRERAAAEGRTECPVTAVVSGAARVPPLLAADVPGHGDVLLVTCAGAGGEALARARHTVGPERVIVAGDTGVDLSAAVAELRARGLPRVLCEGGPRLLRDVAAADVLDELCLTVVPRLTAGVEQRITVGAGVDRALVPRLVVEREGTLLHRWMRP